VMLEAGQSHAHGDGHRHTHLKPSH
jgi:hypothetical protein